MIKKYLTMTLFASIVTMFVACEKDDKSEDGGKVSVADNAIDLGLPSGTKWAKMNIGATNPWDYGDYFAWGETQPKEIFDWSTYQHISGDVVDEDKAWKQINKYQLDDGTNGCWYNNVKYIGDNKTTLDSEDDAAAVNWGGDWVMPSPQDFQELQANCEVERHRDGFLVKANNKEMFIPFSGVMFFDTSFIMEKGSSGPLWTNELSNWTYGAIQVWTLQRDLTNYNFKDDAYTRTNGLCVRGVCKAGGNTNGHDAVDLGLPSGKLWATMNIGAEKPEDSGYYLAWGETEPKQVYNDSTYKFAVKNDLGYYSYNKYQVEDNNIGGVWYTKEFVGDGKSKLEDIDDAAFANWGGKWRIPTKEQYIELMNGCYWLYTQNYADTTNITGFIVYKAKSDRDKGYIVDNYNIENAREGYTMTDTHIFMPCAGRINGDKTREDGIRGRYWMSTCEDIITSYAYSTDLPWGAYAIERFSGNTIRPVCK